MLFKKNKQEKLSYEEEHNKYLSRYKKASRVFIYAGAFNVVGLVISLLQSTQNGNAMFFYFCFGFDNFLFRLLYQIPFLQTSGFWLYVVMMFIIAIFTSSVAILASVFASQGKKKWLNGILISYLIDVLFIIPTYLVGEEYYSCLLMAVFHVIVMAFMGMALYYYQKIIDLALEKGIIKKGEKK